MKQYIKTKPIRWQYEFCFRRDCKTGSLYEFDMYQGSKEPNMHNLGESAAFDLSVSIEGCYCI